MYSHLVIYREQENMHVHVHVHVAIATCMSMEDGPLSLEFWLMTTCCTWQDAGTRERQSNTTQHSTSPSTVEKELTQVVLTCNTSQLVWASLNEFKPPIHVHIKATTCIYPYRQLGNMLFDLCYWTLILSSTYMYIHMYCIYMFGL